MIDDDPSPSSSQQEASRNEIFVPTSDSGLSRDNRRDESETPSSFALSVSFPETGLSPVYRGAYDKACRLSTATTTTTTKETLFSLFNFFKLFKDDTFQVKGLLA